MHQELWKIFEISAGQTAAGPSGGLFLWLGKFFFDA
jgi:hypothetical protein